MTTPNKEAILEKATELFMQKNWQISTNTPEDHELIEGGFYETARNELMRNSGYESNTYLQELAQDAGFDLVKTRAEDTSGYASKYVHPHLCFDLAEMRRGNVLISGMNQTGKTRLACLLADTLQRSGFNVIVFDNSGKWRDLSDIENYTRIADVKDQFRLRQNHLIDMSMLRVKDQRTLVNDSLEFLWLSHLNAPKKSWTIVILEEFELYGKNLRGQLAENIFRIMAVGANVGIRMIAITPCMSIIDTMFIRLCPQRFHFKLGYEENSTRKFSRTYGSDNARIAKSLDVGYCLYFLDGTIKVINVPLWQKPLTVNVKLL